MNPSEDKCVAWLELENGTQLPLRASTLLGSEVDSRDGHRLAYPTVSRKHALITAQEGGEFWILDRGSTNGTYINCDRLYGARRLQDGDRLSLGQSVQFLFRQPVSAEERRATIAGGTIVETWIEQRWLLIIDLQKSTTLSRSIPASELPGVIGAWLNGCRDLISQFGGGISKYTGDGLMAFWRESNDAVGQVAKAVRELQVRQQTTPSFRFVLHRGEIVVGGGPSLGEECLFSPNLSYVCRLEELAKKIPASLLVSASAAEVLQKELPLVPLAGTYPIRDHEAEATVFTVAEQDEKGTTPTGQT